VLTFREQHSAWSLALSLTWKGVPPTTAHSSAAIGRRHSGFSSAGNNRSSSGVPPNNDSRLAFRRGSLQQARIAQHRRSARDRGCRRR